jgi:ABC-2 type transport system permease protein
VSDTPFPLERRRTTGFAYYLRVLRVIGGIDFKSRYTDAVLGYVWSLAKPLAYFGVLYLVFAYLLDTQNQSEDFTVWLLIGVVLFVFFADGVSIMLPSIVERGSVLRRLSFPPVLVPLAASVGTCITFLLNLSVVIVFMVIQDVEPRREWVLIGPLLLELYLFTIGLGLLLSALFVRFRDVSQFWELVAQLLFITCGIFYPIGILPEWAQKVAFLNPIVQVMQDLRNVVLGGSSGLYDLTAADVYPTLGRLVPITVLVLVLVFAFVIFRRESRYFAERV